jgi:hypothetical protein
MGTAVMMERIAEASPHLKARIVGAMLLLAIKTGMLAEFFARGRLGSVYRNPHNIAVTVLLYDIFKRINRRLSLLAAFFGNCWSPVDEEGVELLHARR